MLQSKTSKLIAGNHAENNALNYLKSNGYVIFDKNIFTRFGEIDIVAYDTSNNEIVFVEVRSSSINSNSHELINYRKIGKIKLNVMYWLKKHGKINSDFRIDFIEIVLDNINHIKSAIY